MSSWWADVWHSVIHTDLGFADGELRAGKNLARSLRPEDLEVGPGLVTVRFTGRAAAVAHVSVSAISEHDRDRFVGIAVADTAAAVGIVMGELPAALDASWRAAGLTLVPEAADVGLDCSCDDWAERCRHLAAVGIAIGQLIDRDPYVLLTLRNWDRTAFLDVVRRARAEASGVPFERSDQPRGDDPGTGAAQRYARVAAPLPALRPVPRRPGRPPTFAPPPADSGIETADLERLVVDAARRATAMLAEGADTGLYLDLDADLARIAAGSLDDPAALADLARRAGVDPRELEAGARAWVVGGAAGLAAVAARWTPSPELLEPGRAAVGGTARTTGNVVLGGQVQLRLDPDGRWWRFVADERLGWVLDAGGLDDPAEIA